MSKLSVLVLVLLLVAGVIGLAPAAHAMDTFVVDTDADTVPNGGCDATGDVNLCTLREAIQAANTNVNAGVVDEITFDAALTGATIELQLAYAGDDNASGDLDITEDVLINGDIGNDGTADVTVSALGIRSVTGTAAPVYNHDRVFEITDTDSGTALSVTLRGLTIRDGVAQPGEHGGGVAASFDETGDPALSLTLDNVLVTNNLAAPTAGPAFGGGVWIDEAELNVIDSTISGNVAQWGGGIAIDVVEGTSTLTIQRSTVSGNTTADGPGPPAFGGGISAWYTDVTIENSLITGNGDPSISILGPDGATLFGGTSPLVGGGVFVVSSTNDPPFASTVVTDSLIADNTARVDGGGGFIGAGPLDISGTTFDSNVVGDDAGGSTGGGGLSLSNTSGDITNSTFSGNSADAGAAILALGDGDGGGTTALAQRLSHTTIVGNGPVSTPPADTGAVQVYTVLGGTADLELFNSILESPPGQPTCQDNTGSEAIQTIGGNSDDDGTCNLGVTDQPETTQALGPLSDNGGMVAGDSPTQIVPTHALLPTAEGVDTALSTASTFAQFAPVTCPTVDQRGEPRPIDGDGDGSADCDRGAYERAAQPPPTSSPRTNIGVDKTGPAQVMEGGTADFVLTVTHVSGSSASNVELTDTFPTGLVPTAVDHPDCAISGQDVTCAFGTFTAGQSEVVTVTADATTQGTHTNTACVRTTTTDTDATDDCDDHEIVVNTVDRLGGPERITTAVAGSQEVFDDGAANAVVLTRSDEFPDAQAGTPLAVDRDAPLLLSEPSALNPTTEEEILRVLPAGGTVYLLGGPVALSQAVEDRVAELGFVPVRLGGENRFGTAVEIASELGDPTDLLIANGGSFAEAIVAGAAATTVDGGAAVLLTSGVSVPPETAAYLDGRADAPSLTAIGSDAAAAFSEAPAILGDTPSDLAVSVATTYFANPAAMGVATDAVFADGLTGGAIVNRPGIGPGPILLTPTDTLPDVLATYLEANRDTIGRLLIFGGPAAVSAEVEEQINAILAG